MNFRIWTRRFALTILWVVLFLLAIWETLAIYYSNLPETLRPWAAGLFILVAVLVLLWKYPDARFRRGLMLLMALVLIGWLNMPASNERPWQTDLAVLASADINGDEITVHNIRNCDYRSETDFTCEYYDKTFRLSRLKHVDFFLVYWGSPSIAHTMMSFDFEGEGIVTFSIETRKEVGEAYSTVKGFFRQYEIFYVVADERDVVRLRTNYREGGKGEDVYLYRMVAEPAMAQQVFLSYLREVNRLSQQAQWYNALTDNCTTSILKHTMPYNPKARWDWRLVVNGYIDEMMYERGTLDNRLPFAELKRRSHINDLAQAADQDPEFSRRIRARLLPELTEPLQ